MKRKITIISAAILVIIFCMLSFISKVFTGDYALLYSCRLNDLVQKQIQLAKLIESKNLEYESDRTKIKEEINIVRLYLKKFDFWGRYLEPVSYKQINGPLPVEWETEVFEKFEKPYKRPGAGLTLAYLYLDEEKPEKDSLLKLISRSIKAVETFKADSITGNLTDFHHFFLCNRLFLLNLAAIYTTGFESPDSERTIPELRLMLSGTEELYRNFNKNFPQTALSQAYLNEFKNLIEFVNSQSADPNEFDHFNFLKDHVNILFTMNQQFIRDYKVVSKSYVDYSLNKAANTIFTKNLYTGQNSKGVYLRVNDYNVLSEIENLGRLLFYDPILSGNNMRSCASCHKPNEYFADTSVTTSLHFDKKQSLPRNTPSLINANYNHLLMQDGFHISLQEQALAVITNTSEMFCAEKDVLKKILSCDEYKQTLKSLLKHTPQLPEISMEHISSALTLYYSKFSKAYSPFDEAMNNKTNLNEEEKKGFNLFMSKAQCATCHFVPQFNGVKPPYVGSEFEVLGVPADKNFSKLSVDKGRFLVNPATETANAFRTGSLRNIERTKPYMHNGVFSTLEEVIDFYDAGGGAGRGLQVPNQTLSSDSLHLTVEEKKYLVAFMKSLNEKIDFDPVPDRLPKSKIKSLNNRKVNGEY
ncbi:MAG: cytochrome C peroxidase [Bacteroidia bacterium]|nr:cytochrome C peroxidase [Bacteroidia bacterium]